MYIYKFVYVFTRIYKIYLYWGATHTCWAYVCYFTYVSFTHLYHLCYLCGIILHNWKVFRKALCFCLVASAYWTAGSSRCMFPGSRIKPKPVVPQRQVGAKAKRPMEQAAAKQTKSATHPSSETPEEQLHVLKKIRQVISQTSSNKHMQPLPFAYWSFADSSILKWTFHQEPYAFPLRIECVVMWLLLQSAYWFKIIMCLCAYPRIICRFCDPAVKKICVCSDWAGDEQAPSSGEKGARMCIREGSSWRAHAACFECALQNHHAGNGHNSLDSLLVLLGLNEQPLVVYSQRLLAGANDLSIQSVCVLYPIL